MTKKVEFKDFLEYFPEIELPITLTDEAIFDFSNNNKIIPVELIDKYISPRLERGDSEFREIVPCFRIPESLEINALVFWEGGLMNYEYNLITFDNRCNFISGKVIAGTVSNGRTVQKSVATIDPDWMIFIVAGETGPEDNRYEAGTSRAFNMELQANGEIIFSLDD